MRSAGHISSRIYFKFCTDVHHSQLYTPIVVMLPPVFRLLYGQRSYFGGNLVCAPSAAFLNGFLSYLVWTCILVKSTR